MQYTESYCESLWRYVKKKGIEYFRSLKSSEAAVFENVFYKDGIFQEDLFLKFEYRDFSFLIPAA